MAGLAAIRLIVYKPAVISSYNITKRGTIFVGMAITTLFILAMQARMINSRPIKPKLHAIHPIEFTD